MVNKKGIISLLTLLTLFLGVFASANVGLTVATSGKVNLSSGEVISISVNSEQAKKTVEVNMGAEDCSNCTVELVEIKVDGEIKASYEVKATQSARFLGIFKRNMQVTTNVDAQTGEVISVNKPWWSFLAVKTKAQAEVNTQDPYVSDISQEQNEDGSTSTKVTIKNTDTPSGNVPLSEWCIKGEKYSFQQNGSTSDTVIDGTATYKGSQWCKGTSKTIIKIPGGYSADIEAITTYYFTYGGKEVWVVSNVNGQLHEAYVSNE